MMHAARDGDGRRAMLAGRLVFCLPSPFGQPRHRDLRFYGVRGKKVGP